MVIPKTTSFQFITSINTVAHDDETRRKVRSHARRQKLSNESSPPQSRKSSTQKERISKFRLKPCVQPSETSPKDGTSGRNGNCAKSSSTTKLYNPTLGGPAEAGKNTNFTPTMISRELALVVARELPSFPMLNIETTPLTETLLKYCFTVCLCPHEAMIEKWFDRAGAPTYMMTYYSGFLANAFAMNPEGNFFDALHVDTAITHAFMALVASMHNSLAQWSDTSTFDFHRLQAIKAINERLNVEGKTPNVPISDGITMAVALLVNNETFIGSIQAAAAHMYGLKRIVDLRGGILEAFKYISTNRADFSYAYAAGQPLMFPFVPQLASSLSLHNRFKDRVMEITSRPLGPKDLVIRNRELIDIFELLFSVTECLSTFDYSNLANMSTERVQLSDSIYLGEWRLFQLEQSYRNLRTSKRTGSFTLDDHIQITTETICSPAIDLSESLMFAGHLFMHLALRGQPPAAPRHRGIMGALVMSIHGTLLALDIVYKSEAYGSPKSHHSAGSLGNSSVESWSTTTTNTSILDLPSAKPEDDFTKNALLWILFIGSCVRVPATPTRFHFPHQEFLLDDHHQFFIHALQNYCLMRHITDKETLTAKLKDVLWLNSWCESQLNMVWAEIRDHIMP
ncbi:hypothetical protein F5B22DRAFT_634862 [Xylaria bambusicola]|uniref:uncharacterized protein n=1 Tax=Xylaria bambusicola TaxID=326684 RepID=UPI0020075B2D|nr:uncharacterized protein F5B22DRAFT_634862 [Xylaria bambusicola]KAI0521026.1 hypothetical protein F5B22DRAFT_634862 [Xylaria bambusicola]